MSDYGCKNNICMGYWGKLRTSGASPIFGGHRMALGCSGLHANYCFIADPKLDIKEPVTCVD